MISYLIWKVKFALKIRDIFSKPKGAFIGNHFIMGWKMSYKVYAEMKHIDPQEAALEEVTRWYCE